MVFKMLVFACLEFALRLVNSVFSLFFCYFF